MIGSREFIIKEELLLILMSRIRNDKGQSLVEYGLILALVSIVGLSSAGALGGEINNVFNRFIHPNDTGNLYSIEEINDKINEGYVPLANGDELHMIAKGKRGLFGRGSIWEGSYDTSLNGQYILVDDISLSNHTQGEGWDPIGDVNSPFTGVFDGGGRVVSDLTVNRPDARNQGLFGVVRNSLLQNVTIKDAHIIGFYDVGSLVGKSESSEIKRVKTNQSISGEGYHYGGVVGQLYDSELYESYASGSIINNGKGSSGGIVGWMQHSTLSNSYSDTSIKHTSTGAPGGLVGALWNDSHIYNSYSIGDVTSLKSRPGGLVGYFNNGYSVNQSYWDINLSGQNISAGGMGKSTDDMKKPTTYNGWDRSIWNIVDGQYPTLHQ